jgi:hypothetical protein
VSEEQQDKPTIVGREDLYRQVWETPMSRLGAHYGISGNGLKKICDRLQVPYPPRGYWAKQHAGKRVMRSPLPPRGPGMSDEVLVGGRPYYRYEVSIDELAKPIPLPPEFPEGIEETRKRALRAIGKIKVENSTVQQHRLIGRLLDEDNERREKQQSSAYSYSWNKPLFEAQWEQRRLRILNALFCAMDAIGFTPWLRGKDGRDLGIRIGAQSVSLRLERVERSLARKKSAGRRADPLCFDILVSFGSEEVRNSWSDVENGRIERQLRAIAVEIIVAGEIKYRESVRANYNWKVQRKAQLEEHARRREAELERQERERRASLERERVERLLNDANAFKQANEIRAYVETVRASILAFQGPIEDTALDSWCAWANAEADRLDPIKSRRFRIE